MSKLTKQIRINAPKETVWAKLADLPAVQDYSIGVAKAYWTSETKEGVGAGRHCDLQNPSGFVEERVTEWQQDRVMTIEIYESNAPLKSAFAHFTLTPDSEGTIVNLRFDYEMKFGPIGALMDLLFVRRLFRKANDTLLAGLKHHIETGEIIGAELPTAAAAAA